MILTQILGCESRNTILSPDSGIEIKSEDVSFDFAKTDVSKISYLLGIKKFSKNQQIRPDELSFDIEGVNNVINGEDFNLDHSKIFFKKISAVNYSIKTYFKDWGVNATLMVNNSSHTFVLQYNSLSINLKEHINLTSRQRMVALILLNYYDEIRISNPYLDHKSGLHSEDEAPIGRFYYGYTMGWGFTKEQSIDDELNVRGGAGSLIVTYKCKLLGTSTSCFYESIGCVTISTFTCSTNN